MKRGDVLAAIADLTGDDVARRQAAVRVLEAMPRGFLEDHPLPRKKVAPYVPRLGRLLASDVPNPVKKWCAQLVGESGILSAETLSALVGALENKDDEVLVSTIWAIGAYGPGGSPAVDALILHTRHPNREVRWRAVWALSRIRPKGQRYAEGFAKLFADEDHLACGYAVIGFASAATPSSWAVAQLERAAKDVHDMPRIHARRTLEQWANEGRT
jgi:HEAT repeat protein